MGMFNPLSGNHPAASSMKTVWIHIDTDALPGDPDHLKVFASGEAANCWLEDNDPGGAAFAYISLRSEPHQARVHDPDCGARPMESFEALSTIGARVKFKIPEIVLGALLATAVFAVGMSF
jgi:hypothetical protein